MHAVGLTNCVEYHWWDEYAGAERSLVGCLHDPANVQQFTCILNTFAGSLLDVCWIV